MSARTNPARVLVAYDTYRVTFTDGDTWEITDSSYDRLVARCAAVGTVATIVFVSTVYRWEVQS